VADRVVDSDVLIDALRGVPAANATLARLVREMTVATTTINLFELECGVETDEEHLRVRELLENLDLLPVDALAAVEAAAIDRELRRHGRRIDTRDTLIAGVARSYDIPLVTRNRRHFDRIEGLRVEGLDPS